MSLPATLTLRLTPDIPLELVLIPACPEGFLMGSRGYYAVEEPRHRVIIPQPFYLGKYPVTQEQFACFKPEHENHFKGNPQHPAESMDWYEAEAFCQWVQEKLPAGWIAHLPSEAQWEYACRAGTDTEYHSGDGEAALREVGWFDGNSGRQTQPVGRLAENAWGLHDMHGNVLEWCADVWDSAAYPQAPEGTAGSVIAAATDEMRRVLRGGSWFRSAWFCRSAYRYWWGPRYRLRSQGVRLAVSPGPVVQEPASQERSQELEPGGKDDRKAEAEGAAWHRELRVPGRSA